MGAPNDDSYYINSYECDNQRIVQQLKNAEQIICNLCSKMSRDQLLNFPIIFTLYDYGDETHHNHIKCLYDLYFYYLRAEYMSLEYGDDKLEKERIFTEIKRIAN